MSRILTFVAAVAGLFIVSTAQANVILFANITNAVENPPTNPTTSAGLPRSSFGTALFNLNDAQTAMTFTATIVGIDFTGSQTPSDPNDNLVAAHIHASPTAAPTAANAPVVWGFFGSPFNDLNSPTAGLLSDCTASATGVGGTCTGTWDLNEGNGVVSPGVPVTLANQLPNILSGHSYINFHTTQFPGGETRGFLVVAEPSSLALLGLGAFGLFAFGLRRKVSPKII